MRCDVIDDPLVLIFPLAQYIIHTCYAHTYIYINYNNTKRHILMHINVNVIMNESLLLEIFVIIIIIIKIDHHCV